MKEMTLQAFNVCKFFLAPCLEGSRIKGIFGGWAAI